MTAKEHDSPAVTITLQSLPPLLLTEAQAAQLLAISERHLWNLTNTNQIPAVYLSERVKRYRPADLQAYVDRLSGNPPPAGA